MLRIHKARFRTSSGNLYIWKKKFNSNLLLWCLYKKWMDFEFLLEARNIRMSDVESSWTFVDAAICITVFLCHWCTERRIFLVRVLHTNTKLYAVSVRKQIKQMQHHFYSAIQLIFKINLHRVKRNPKCYKIYWNRADGMQKSIKMNFVLLGI